MLFLSNSLFSQENAINDLIAKQKYNEAIDVILMGGKTESLPTSSLESLGYCYVMIYEYSEAEIVYAELLSRPKTSLKNHVSYAELLLMKNEYQQAKDHFLTYLAENEDDKYVYNRMLSCDSIKKWDNDEDKYEIENLVEINSDYNEICAIGNSEEFIFLSNRRNKEEKEFIPKNEIPEINLCKSGEINKVKEYITQNYWCSLVTYNESRNQYAYSLRKIIESVKGFTLAKSVIMFENENNNSIDGLEKFTWEGMPDNINVSHPSFTKNGKRIFFTSDMPGGYGGMDIYYSDFENNLWTLPVNLGEEINTPLNDIAPVVNDSVLYYSSRGLPGYGNYDVFVSKIDGNTFSKPINLQAPINSIGEDLFFYPYIDNKSLLSSNRSEMGKGGFDVFMMTRILEEEPELITEDSVADIVVVHELNITDFELPKVFFKLNSSEVQNNYNNVLKNLADSLIVYDDVKVNLAGYTDISGTDALNSELSVDRAKSVAKVLIKYGVSESQITFEGLGKKQDTVMLDLSYSVVVGTTTSDDGVQWFNELFNNEYEVSVMPNNKYYFYCIGDFDNMNDAELLIKELRKEHDIDFFPIASYLGRCLPNYKRAINRRVDFILYRENKNTAL